MSDVFNFEIRPAFICRRRLTYQRYLLLPLDLGLGSLMGRLGDFGHTVNIIVVIEEYPLVAPIPAVPVTTTIVGDLIVSTGCAIYSPVFFSFPGRANVQWHRLQCRSLHLEATR
jgi:hypothetical protein